MKMVAAVFELSPQIGAVGQVRVGDGVDGAFFVGRNDPEVERSLLNPRSPSPMPTPTYIALLSGPRWASVSDIRARRVWKS